MGRSKTRCDVPPVSMPFTATSATVRSTAFKASFALSTADFCARREVEKEALGAKRNERSVVVDVRVRNDILGTVMRE
jgi:hypothetical protein